MVEIGLGFFVLFILVGIYLSHITTSRKHKKLLDAFVILLDGQSAEIKSRWWTTKLKGYFRGRKVKVYLHTSTSTSDPEPGLRLTLFCNSLLSFKVTKGFWHFPSVGRKLTVGDPDLDEKFQFSCRQDISRQFTGWVHAREVRNNIQSLLYSRGVLSLELTSDDDEPNQKILQVTGGPFLDVSDVRAALESMEAMARSLEELGV